MEVKNKVTYEAPAMLVVEVKTEGIICGSQDRSIGNPEERQNAGSWGDF